MSIVDELFKQKSTSYSLRNSRVILIFRHLTLLTIESINLDIKHLIDNKFKDSSNIESFKKNTGKKVLLNLICSVNSLFCLNLLRLVRCYLTVVAWSLKRPLIVYVLCWNCYSLEKTPTFFFRFLFFHFLFSTFRSHSPSPIYCCHSKGARRCS